MLAKPIKLPFTTINLASGLFEQPVLLLSKVRSFDIGHADRGETLLADKCFFIRFSLSGGAGKLPIPSFPLIWVGRISIQHPTVALP